MRKESKNARIDLNLLQLHSPSKDSYNRKRSTQLTRQNNFICNHDRSHFEFSSLSKYLEEEEEEEEEKNGTEATSFCISFSLSLSLFVSRLTHRASISPSRPAKTLVVTVIRVNYSSERERWRETERKNHARAAHEENSYLSREKKKRERERERNARARAHRRALCPLSPRTSRRVLEHAFGLSQFRISNENSSSNSNNNNEMTTMTRKTSFSADIFCEEGSSFAGKQLMNILNK